MFASARQTYDAATKISVSGREIEARALSKAAQLLQDCIQHWDTPTRSARLDEAIRFNQRLWSVFQAELGRPDHELPLELRVNLLRLSQFIDRRSLEVLSDPAPSKLQALIDLNRTIAEGLRMEPATVPAV